MLRARAERWLAALGLALAAAPSVARPVDGLQVADAEVQSVGWKLAHANARFCKRAAPGIGLLLQDARTFEDPAAARAVYGLSGDIAVGAVADDGPAARAGLQANDTIVAIAGEEVGPPLPGKDRWTRLFALQTRMETAVADKGAVTLTLAGGRTITITGEPACRVRFLLDDGGGNASSSRDDVRVGRGLYNATKGDDALLAAIVAHELAHAALDHQTTLEAASSNAVVRQTEREADRLAVWLLANAGYPPEAEERLMRTVIARRQFLIGSSSHGGWRTRAADIHAELAALAAAPDADWPLRFKRNVAP
ncbi:PDZ domain-containing protein [Novosphingobium sp.]|uniref:PDZ domain-containing protein n=1 Tax=Novosphingobium sp. TaxID=1874826 RepID=UPI0038BDEED0